MVQRLPVRIRLNPSQLAAHPLRVGLSMDAKIDLHSDTAPQLARHAPLSDFSRIFLKGQAMLNLSADLKQPPPLEGGMLRVAGIVLALANFVAVLNLTIANVTVPDIAGHWRRIEPGHVGDHLLRGGRSHHGAADRLVGGRFAR